MSRIGKQPITIPNAVTVNIDDHTVTVKGPKGTLKRTVSPSVKITAQDNQVLVALVKNEKKTQALWGLERALIANMVKGVSDGFEKVLQYEGIGYRANLKGTDLELIMGFSHPVIIEKEEGITFQVDKGKITVQGIDKHLVGNIAAKIRKVRPLEPYKLKGIRYEGETIKKKAGKRVVGT